MNQHDPTEAFRRAMVAENNAAVESDDNTAERDRLERLHGVGNVWDTQQLQEHFTVLGFQAPFVVCERKVDKKKVTLEFQNAPRFYFALSET